MEKIDISDFRFLEIEPGEYSLDFKVMESRIINGKPDALELIYGYLKWDGCMNWSTNKNIMMHFCEAEEADEISTALKRVYDVGEEFIERWSLE